MSDYTNTQSRTTLDNFMIYSDTLEKRLDYVLMENNKIIAYASRKLKERKRNYLSHDIELAALAFTLKI